jgi:hypothetical protein
MHGDETGASKPAGSLPGPFVRIAVRPSAERPIATPSALKDGCPQIAVPGNTMYASHGKPTGYTGPDQR